MTAIVKYFVGGELEAFADGSHSSTTWVTTVGTYDPDFARGAVALNFAGNGYIRIPLISAQAACWTSLQLRMGSGGASLANPTKSAWVEWLNASLVAMYRLFGVGGTQSQPLLQFQYWSGSAWVNIGSPRVVPTDALHKFDVRTTIDNTTGELAAYVDGVLLGTLSGDTSFVASATVAEVRVNNCGQSGVSNGAYISEVRIVDSSTLGRRMATLYLTGTGATDGWTPSTGATSVATLDESGTYDDSDYASSPTANQIYTGVTSDLSTAAQQYAIDGVVIAYRALKGALGPQNLKGVLRIGGTNYPSTNNVDNLLTDSAYTWAEFDLNPATGVAFTPAEINTAGFETGAKSIT